MSETKNKEFLIEEEQAGFVDEYNEVLSLIESTKISLSDGDKIAAAILVALTEFKYWKMRENKLCE